MTPEEVKEIRMMRREPWCYTTDAVACAACNALDEVERLTAEVARLQRELDAARADATTIVEITSPIVNKLLDPALQAECKEIVRNAARWKWCEANVKLQGSLSGLVTDGGRPPSTTFIASLELPTSDMPESFTAAVDDAIAKEQQK